MNHIDIKVTNGHFCMAICDHRNLPAWKRHPRTSHVTGQLFSFFQVQPIKQLGLYSMIHINESLHVPCKSLYYSEVHLFPHLLSPLVFP